MVPMVIRADFSLRQGAFVLEIHQDFAADTLALVGPSGAGKTSFIEAVAGIRTPIAGTIGLDGRVVFSAAARVNVPARHRRIGYVPQDALLFPHLDVRRNVLYGAAAAGPLPLARVIDMLEIGALLTRRVDRLSGGERQRVALARALMTAPSLLVLDEPFAALDPSLRERVVSDLQRVRDEARLPMIVASHDPGVVDAIADAIVELRGGQVTAVRTMRPGPERVRS
jgi:molybdate transport system ATP-binding protein